MVQVIVASILLIAVAIMFMLAGDYIFAIFMFLSLIFILISYKNTMAEIDRRHQEDKERYLD